MCHWSSPIRRRAWVIDGTPNENTGVTHGVLLAS